MNPRKPPLLVVDDDPHTRKLGGRLGTDAGFEAMLCAGGAEALDVLGRTAVDLALVDLCMPEMNGLEVLRTIRERGGSCEVVLMSGYATIDSAVEAVKLGARDCLGKRLGGVTPNAERQLLSATWDGNVRELRNTVERACILAQGDVITERDLEGGGAPARRSGSRPAPTPTSADTATAAALPTAADSRLLSIVEREHVLHVLQQTGSNKKAAAKIVGISRRSLYRLLEEHAAAMN
jgi:DNA-binding NtrC family response regulator